MARTKQKQITSDWVEGLMFRSVVLGRSATLYRNVANTLFPERLSEEDRVALRDLLCDALLKEPGVLGRKAFALKAENDDFEHEADRLLSYGLVTKSFLEHKAGAAIVGGPGTVAVCVNDEDHLTFKCSDPKPFADQWQSLNAAAEAFEKRLPFANSPVYGYLSANPEHSGTGLKLTCSFCFFGLFLMKEMEQVLRGIERLGFDISPVFVLSEEEESPLDSPGCCYRITSTQTMGKEEPIIERMERICAEVANQEQNARLRLMEERHEVLYDFVRRSVAVGSVAAQVSESEGIDIVNAMLFALDMSLFKTKASIWTDLHALLVQMPGSALRYLAKTPPEEDAMDMKAMRAAIIRPVAMQLLPACLDKI